MESILDSLPAQPLTADAVEALDDAAPVHLIPYSWSGRQAVTLVLDEDGTLSGGQSDPPTAATASSGRSFEPSTTSEPDEDRARDTGKTRGFDTDDDGSLGTVEVVEESQLPDGNPFADLIDGNDRTGADDASQTAGDDDTHDSSESRWAVGYDPDETTWVFIDDLDPGASFAEIEPLMREWLTEVYSEGMLDRLVVGPSEYDED
jgi:hypothetical protein